MEIKSFDANSGLYKNNSFATEFNNEIEKFIKDHRILEQFRSFAEKETKTQKEQLVKENA